jgi:hypothetical protein
LAQIVIDQQGQIARLPIQLQEGRGGDFACGQLSLAARIYPRNSAANTIACLVRRPCAILAIYAIVQQTEIAKRIVSVCILSYHPMLTHSHLRAHALKDFG